MFNDWVSGSVAAAAATEPALSTRLAIAPPPPDVVLCATFGDLLAAPTSRPTPVLALGYRTGFELWDTSLRDDTYVRQILTTKWRATSHIQIAPWGRAPEPPATATTRPWLLLASRDQPRTLAAFSVIRHDVVQTAVFHSEVVNIATNAAVVAVATAAHQLAILRASDLCTTHVITCGGGLAAVFALGAEWLAYQVVGRPTPTSPAEAIAAVAAPNGQAPPLNDRLVAAADSSIYAGAALVSAIRTALSGNANHARPSRVVCATATTAAVVHVAVANAHRAVPPFCQVVPSHRKVITLIAFDAPGLHLLTVADGGQHLRLWRIAGPGGAPVALVAKFRRGTTLTRIASAAFSARSNVAAIISAPRGTTHVFRVASAAGADPRVARVHHDRGGLPAIAGAFIGGCSAVAPPHDFAGACAFVGFPRGFRAPKEATAGRPSEDEASSDGVLGRPTADSGSGLLRPPSPDTPPPYDPFLATCAPSPERQPTATPPLGLAEVCFTFHPTGTLAAHRLDLGLRAEDKPIAAEADPCAIAKLCTWDLGRMRGQTTNLRWEHWYNRAQHRRGRGTDRGRPGDEALFHVETNTYRTQRWPLWYTQLPCTVTAYVEAPRTHRLGAQLDPWGADAVCADTKKRHIAGGGDASARSELEEGFDSIPFF